MPDPSWLQVYGFVTIGFALTVFAVLDGFDLGIGLLLPFVGRQADKQVMIDAIWPVWDGNELWALTGGAMLFALFPAVFATLLSVLYPVIALLMLALLFRPITFELWYHDTRRRRIWEWSFFLTSLTITVVAGAAYGLALAGMPFSAPDKFSACLKAVLTPLPLLTVMLFASAFLMQAGAYLMARAEDPVRAMGYRLFARAWVAFAALVAVWFVTAMSAKHAWGHGLPWAFGIVAVVLTVLARVLAARAGERRLVFLSGAAIASLFPVIGALQYPVVLANSYDAAASLTVTDGSPAYTFRLVTVLATVMLTIVAGYTVFVYRVFRHKVKAGEQVY